MRNGIETTTNNGRTNKGETMKTRRPNIDFVLATNYLMNNVHVCKCVARLHVDANAADVVAHVAPQLSGIDETAPRDIALFFSACVARHYSNRAAYTVAARAVS